MKLNLYKCIAKFSNINAIFGNAPGLLPLLFPTSALGGAFCFAGIASAVAVAFPFGFGAGGTSGFARIAGISAILLGVYAITVCLRNKKLAALGAESEEE